MKALRNIAPIAPHKTLYLTFDDGPDLTGTPSVLKTLARLKVGATFFTVSQKVQAHPSLFEQIRAEGHAIGNHSLDHGYRNFFKGTAALSQWIQKSESILQEKMGSPSVGFRPPNGIQTPELHRALKELHLPLILWSRRFYDTAFQWNSARALKSLARTQPGDIILLHDRQLTARLPRFLETLEVYIEEARIRGYEFSTLNRDSCARAQKWS